jgi:hypothetical protein
MKNMRVLAKLSVFALIFLMWSNTTFSQSKIPVESITTDWSLFHEANGVKFYIKKESRSSSGRLDVDYALIKLENTSNKKLNVAYSPVVHYNSGCNGCGSNEFYRTLEIPAHSSVEGKLTDANLPVVVLLSNPNLKNGLIPQSVALEKLSIN